jgi:transcription elongation factor/antiterminator RfaH
MIDNSKNDYVLSSRDSQSPVTGHQSLKLKWYVIQTKPQLEDIVKRHLENAEFEVFNPKIKAAVRGKNKTQTRVKSFFPSYVFVHTNFDDANIFHMIKYTRGVHKILGSGKPVAIPAAVVNTIRERVGEGDVLVQQMVFSKGDKVRVKAGYLEDLVGILEKPVSAEGRVRLLLEIVGKCVRAELSSAEIEPLG